MQWLTRTDAALVSLQAGGSAAAVMMRESVFEGRLWGGVRRCASPDSGLAFDLPNNSPNSFCHHVLLELLVLFLLV